MNTTKKLKISDVSLRPSSIGEVNEVLESLGKNGKLVVEITRGVDEVVNTAFWAFNRLQKKQNPKIPGMGPEK